MKGYREHNTELIKNFYKNITESNVIEVLLGRIANFDMFLLKEVLDGNGDYYIKYLSNPALNEMLINNLFDNVYEDDSELLEFINKLKINLSIKESKELIKEFLENIQKEK